jgi:hypothetical protein
MKIFGPGEHFLVEQSGHVGFRVFEASQRGPVSVCD